MKLLRLIANLGYGSRKQVAAMFREAEAEKAVSAGVARALDGSGVGSR